jgi:hypothetical protein
MATTTTQTLNSCSNYTDDMPEYISIYDRPKRGSGRPKLYVTPEELAESKRVASNNYHKIHYLEYKDAKNLKRNLKRSADKENKNVIIKT